MPFGMVSGVARGMGVLAIATDTARCMLCVLRTQASCAKTAELMLSWFGGRPVGPNNHLLDGEESLLRRKMSPAPPARGLIQCWRPLSSTTGRNQCHAAGTARRPNERNKCKSFWRVGQCNVTYKTHVAQQCGYRPSVPLAE